MHSCSDTNVRNYFVTEKMLKQGARSQKKGKGLQTPKLRDKQVNASIYLLAKTAFYGRRTPFY